MFSRSVIRTLHAENSISNRQVGEINLLVKESANVKQRNKDTTYTYSA